MNIRSIANLRCCVIFLLALCFSHTTLAQYNNGNFTFTGYVTFSDGNTSHKQSFTAWQWWGQDAPIPGYTNHSGQGGPGEFHLSCSDPLIGNTAQVNYAHFDTTYSDAGDYGFADPDAYFADGTTVTIVDFRIERMSMNGQGVAVCEPDKPEIAKTADGTFDLSYAWSIEKTVTPASADLFFGDSQEFAYTVTVDSDGTTPTNHAVSGTIAVRNVLAEQITITAVDDNFTGSSNMDITCPDLPAILPTAVDTNPQLVCTYTADSDGTPGTNTATVTFTRGAAVGIVGQASDEFDFSGDPENIINDTVNVQDVFDGNTAEDLGTCNKDDVPCVDSYSRTLDCSDINAQDSGDSGMLPNTASIVETSQDSSKSATLTCFKLGVTKTAESDFTREYLWVADKTISGDNPVSVMEGQAYELDYEIMVDLDDPGYTDSLWSVSGGITINNPALVAATVNSLVDAFNGGTGTVNCGSDAPWVIAAESSLNCTYSGDSDGTTPGINTATATQQNYAYDDEGTGSASGTTNYSGTAPFTMDTPTTSVNACVDVWDLLTVDGDAILPELLLQQNGLPEDASICRLDAPYTFGFSVEETWFPVGSSVEEPPLCEWLIDNEAFVYPFRDDQANALAYDIVEASIRNAECVFGCTLTQGYWKTHSTYGPAPYDETWAVIGEDTPFFLSGDSWHGVLWTPPKGGNAYYILAHQWIAASLNVINEANTTPAVDAALSAAEEVFEVCGPADFAKSNFKKKGGGGSGSCGGASARDLKKWASTLDRYNNGDIGPGHCSENETDEGEPD